MLRCTVLVKTPRLIAMPIDKISVGHCEDSAESLIHFWRSFFSSTRAIWRRDSDASRAIWRRDSDATWAADKSFKIRASDADRSLDAPRIPLRHRIMLPVKDVVSLLRPPTFSRWYYSTLCISNDSRLRFFCTKKSSYRHELGTVTSHDSTFVIRSVAVE